MEFSISGATLDPVFLVVLGLLVGVMGGFFGVGGSFIIGPSLFAAGLPMNYVVGTDLAHVAGKSVMAAKKHRALGNVDLRLGWIMTLGTIGGVEAGAQAIEALKKTAHVDRVVALTFLSILLFMFAFMAYEGFLSLRRMKSDREKGLETPDEPALAHIARWVQSLRLGPMVSLPTSGIPRISLGAILLVSFIGGLCSGFLGGGAGYIRMPMMVFLLGIPTHVAVGTDLFEIMISAGYGTVTHALKGNVDVMIALVMQTGAAIGAQIGVMCTQYISGPRIRLAFAPLPLIGAVLILYKLIYGGGGH